MELLVGWLSKVKIRQRETMMTRQNEDKSSYKGWIGAIPTVVKVVTGPN
jgi:hypothetical protein